MCERLIVVDLREWMGGKKVKIMSLIIFKRLVKREGKLDGIRKGK